MLGMGKNKFSAFWVKDTWYSEQATRVKLGGTVGRLIHMFSVYDIDLLSLALLWKICLYSLFKYLMGVWAAFSKWRQKL